MRIAAFVAVGMLALQLSMSGAAAAQGPCALPVELPRTVANERLVFLGEYHGTRETPLFAAEFACTVALPGQRVTLALEMSQTEQPALDAYLVSDGGEAAKRTLLSTSFWRTTRDGRASTGTLAMIDRVRALRSAGLKVDLLALDGVSAGTRDETMAEKLREAMQQDGSRRIIFLAGNMHARRAARGDGFDPGYESVAWLLRDQPAVALEVLPQSGAAWMCHSKDVCGPIDVSGPPGAETRSAQIRMGYHRMPGYDGTVLLPKVTAAEPAVDALNAKNPL